MDINVTFENGRWVTDPNPAIVAVGTPVRWILRTPDLTNQSLTWKVSFQYQIPFGQDRSILRVITRAVDRRGGADFNPDVMGMLNLSEEAAVRHRGLTEALPANLPGEFKYDLVVEDSSTGEQIGEDDPWLIVVRGIIRPFDIYVF